MTHDRSELDPLPEGFPLADLSALLRSLPHLDPENAEAFAADIEQVRQEAAAFPPRDPSRKGKPLFELGQLLDSLPRLTDAEADDYLADIEKARQEGRNVPLRDPWDL